MQPAFPVAVEPIRFLGQIRYFKPELSSGLAVVDVPPEQVQALGGLRQQRVRGSIGPAAFASSLMPAGSGRLALSVSKAMMAAGRVGVGDTAEFTIESLGRE